MRRIRTRLIVAFLVVAILPAVPLSVVVRDLLQRSFGPALDATVEEALEAGLDQSRQDLQRRKEALRRRLAADWLPRLTDPAAPPAAGFVLLDQEGEVVGEVSPVPALSRLVARPLPAGGAEPPEPVREDNYLAVAVVAAGGNKVVIAQALPTEMAERAGRLTGALSLIRTLREERGRVLRSYVVPFLLVYGLLILLAAGVGALLARRIARPVEALVASTHRVAAGDLTARVEDPASGEVGVLVASFNRMVAKLAEQRRELARLERVAAWRDLARTLAHEIKNPLTPILLAVQSARDSYRGRNQQHAAMLGECETIVREEVEGLRELVREFSEFARLPRPEPAPGDLKDLLGELSRLYREQQVVCDLLESPLPARFDAAELRRALLNLIDNGLAACAAAGKRERVVLTARSAGDAIRIEVTDEGAGISQADLARVFEPGFSTKKDSMGLGLCIVEGIVCGHGGSIAVRSEPGAGTTFTIRLPVLPPEGEKE